MLFPYTAIEIIYPTEGVCLELCLGKDEERETVTVGGVRLHYLDSI